MPDEHREKIMPILNEFVDLFTEQPRQCQTVTVTYRITLKSPTIINEKPYPTSPEKKKLMYEQLQEMLKLGVVEPCASEYIHRQ